MKRIFTRILSLLCLLLMLAQTVACGGTPADTQTETVSATDTETETATETETDAPLPSATKDFSTDDWYTLENEVVPAPDENGLDMGWSATALDFNAYCEGSLTVTAYTERGVNLRVFMDGEDMGFVSFNVPPTEIQTPFVAEAKTETLTVLENIPRGEHSFRLVKMSRSYLTLLVKDVTISGEFLAPNGEKDLLIAFYGDSLLEGFGIHSELLDTFENVDQNWFYFDDASSTFAYQTVMALDADYTINGMCGIGMKWGWLSNMYGGGLRSSFGYANYFRDTTVLRDLDAERVPDVIVIQLGLNDHLSRPYHDTPFPEVYETVGEGMVEEIVDFLPLVKNAYGAQVPIVVISGSFPQDSTNEWVKALDELGGEDAGYYHLVFPAGNDGLEDHPNVQNATEEAALLQAFLKEKLPEIFLATSELPQKTYSFTESGWCRILGDVLPTENGVSAGWSGTAFEFTALCEGDVTLTATADEGAQFHVYMDSQDLGTVQINEPESHEASSYVVWVPATETVTLASDVPRGKHTFRVVKSARTTVGEEWISVSYHGAAAYRTPERDTLIQFVGDSILEGYGIYDTDEVPNGYGYYPPNAFYYDDAALSYAHGTALALDVDYNCRAVSGMGIIWGYTAQTAMDMMDYVDYYRDTEALRDTENARVPDLIVVNLGANDEYNRPQRNSSILEIRELVGEAWVELAVEALPALRASYGGAPVVIVSGVFGEDMAAEWDDVLEQLGGEDAGYYHVTLPLGKDGRDGHPSAANAKEETEVLSAYLKATFPDLF